MNSNLILFFDGCHKIYYAERTDAATIKQMEGWGYEIIDGNFSQNLERIWRDSCSLRFVQPANFESGAPEVKQFQEGGLRGFRTKLKQHFESE